jgi:hypothetical protein
MGSERARTIAALIAAALIVAVVLFVVGGNGGSGGPSGSPPASAPGSASASASVIALETPTTPPSATPAATSASPSTPPSAAPSRTTPPASATPAPPSSAPTAAPTATPPPPPSATISGRDLSGTWKGTWTNVTPDQASGILEVTWTQTGSALDGTIVFDSPCSNAASVQGTVTGPGVEFSTVGRDEAAFRGVVTVSRITGTFTSSCDTSTGTFELTKAP